MKATLRTNGKHASPAAPATVRVAIYCRQSVDRSEGSEFGSIDAQREAVLAYVASQRAQGWAALPETYDDGGFSGATVDRPAFQRLLADIGAGCVDVVACYRLDRLSRSILDFARLMDAFNAQGVAFVSVTEHFDTSTATGRMVLHLLATFAQFERETIAQRTKDKMLATRRRGMWTGGLVPLGYDLVEKKLVVNEPEAERVRAIFALYLELGSLLLVADELRRRGWMPKVWTTKAGTETRPTPFSKSSVDGLLKNVIYLGKIHAGDEVVEAEHDAIVDQGTWDAVQALLRANAGGRDPRHPRESKNGALLARLAFCGRCGSALIPHYAGKGPKRYGSYVCRKLHNAGAKSCPGSRVPAGKLEAHVVEQLREIGRDPALIEATLEADRADREARKPELIAEVRRLTADQTRLEAERANLVEAIATGGSAAHVLMARLAEADREIDQACQRLAEARGDLAALEMGDLDPGELRAALADLEPVWSELFPRERARVLALLLERVTFDADRGEVAITFRPGGPRALQERAR